MQISQAPSSSQGSTSHHILGRGNGRISTFRKRLDRKGKDNLHTEIAQQVLQMSPKGSPAPLPSAARAAWTSSTHGLESLLPIVQLSCSKIQPPVPIDRLNALEYPPLTPTSKLKSPKPQLTIHTCALETPPMTPRSSKSNAEQKSSTCTSIQEENDEATIEVVEVDDEHYPPSTQFGEGFDEIEAQDLSVFLAEPVTTEPAQKSPCSISAETVNAIAVEALSTAPDEAAEAVTPRRSSIVLAETVQAVVEGVLLEALSNPSVLSNPLKEAVTMSTQALRLADSVGTPLASSTSTTSVSTSMGTMSSSPVDSTTVATQVSAREIFERAETSMPKQELLVGLRKMQLAALSDAVQVSGDQILTLDKLNDTFHAQNKSSLKQLKRVGAFRSDLEKQVAGIQKDGNYKSNKADIDSYTSTSKAYEPTSDVSVKLCRELEVTIAALTKNIADFSVPANTTSGGLIALERDLGVSKKSFAGVLNKAGSRTKCIETQWALVSADWEKQKNALTTSLEQLNHHDLSIRSSLNTYKELVYPETKPFIKATWTTMLWSEKGNATPYHTPELPAGNESTTNDSEALVPAAKAS